MISLYRNTNDLHALYGIEHFIQKYGIPMKINDEEKSKISIVYGTKDKGDFVIQIQENNIQDEISGLVEINDTNTPLFEAPINTSSDGRILARYRNDNEKYPCITYKDNKIFVGFDIFKETGHVLSGCLENLWKKIDVAERRKISKKPVIDVYEEILFNSLLLASQKLKVPLVQKAFWPEGKKFAVCLTHDVDEITKKYQYITNTLRCLKKRNFAGIKNQLITFIEKIKGNEPYWTFDTIREVENKLEVKSTFFFLNEKGKVNLIDPSTWKHYARIRNINDPKLVKEIKKLHSEGWDVGLHGSFYSYLDIEKLKEEKEELEKILNAKVYGNRQHCLNISIPDTWRYHEKIGLDYDTTLGFNDCMGFRWGTCFPFQPFDPNEKRTISLLEIPLVIEDVTFFSYEGVNWNDCFDIANTVEKYNGVLTLLWHHTVFNDYEYPGWAERYRKLIEFCKDKNAWITSAHEISNWWKNRGNNKFEYGYKEGCLKIMHYSKDADNNQFKVYLPENMSAYVKENAEIVYSDKNLIILKPLDEKGIEMQFNED